MKKLVFNITLCFAILMLSINNKAFAQTINTNAIDSVSTVESVQEIENIIDTKPRLKFGCGFGLNFLGGTNISLSPNLMYAVSDKFSIGAGLQGSYISIKDVQKTTTFGINVLGEYNLSRKIMTLLEFAQLKVSTTKEDPANYMKNKFWESALFLGAGYNINNKISIGAKFNVLYNDDESVYSSPIIPFVNITF